MKKLILLLLFIPLVSFGQKDIKNAIQICTSFSNFDSLEEANETLELILDAAGLSKNFSLFPCDGIPNAAAFTFNGDRYIFYNKDFMSNIKNKTNEISNIFILAHEVGHHVNYHTKDLLLAMSGDLKIPALSEKRKQELEADEFAGFVMARLGYSIMETKEAIKNLKDDWRTQEHNDDQHSTHPTILKRLGAINIGYFKVNPPKMTGMEFWDSAMEKFNNEDYYGAESDLLGCIEIGDFGFVRSALAKSQYYIAVNDSNQNGYSDYTIDKLLEANENIKIAISEDDDDPELYFWKGNIDYMLVSRLDDKAKDATCEKWNHCPCENWNLAVKIGGQQYATNLNLCN